MVLAKGLASLKYRYWRQRIKQTPLRAIAIPSQLNSNMKAQDQSFIVIDCEMTGLDPSKHRIVSIGWVLVKAGRIDYSSRKHFLLHEQQETGESIAFHGLSDKRIAGAQSPSVAMTALAQDVGNRVTIFHHAVLDLSFLNRLCKRTFGCPFIVPFLDTLLIEQGSLQRQSKTGSLQLNLCRDRYHLPTALAHNAMYDACATAELLMAQLSQFSTSITLNSRFLKLGWS